MSNKRDSSALFDRLPGGNLKNYPFPRTLVTLQPDVPSGGLGGLGGQPAYEQLTGDAKRQRISSGNLKEFIGSLTPENSGIYDGRVASHRASDALVSLTLRINSDSWGASGSQLRNQVMLIPCEKRHSGAWTGTHTARLNARIKPAEKAFPGSLFADLSIHNGHVYNGVTLQLFNYIMADYESKKQNGAESSEEDEPVGGPSAEGESSRTGTGSTRSVKGEAVASQVDEESKVPDFGEKMKRVSEGLGDVPETFKYIVPVFQGVDSASDNSTEGLELLTVPAISKLLKLVSKKTFQTAKTLYHKYLIYRQVLGSYYVYLSGYTVDVIDPELYKTMETGETSVAEVYNQIKEEERRLAYTRTLARYVQSRVVIILEQIKQLGKKYMDFKFPSGEWNILPAFYIVDMTLFTEILGIDDTDEEVKSDLLLYANRDYDDIPYGITSANTVGYYIKTKLNASKPAKGAAPKMPQDLAALTELRKMFGNSTATSTPVKSYAGYSDFVKKIKENLLIEDATISDLTADIVEAIETKNQSMKQFLEGEQILRSNYIRFGAGPNNEGKGEEGSIEESDENLAGPPADLSELKKVYELYKMIAPVISEDGNVTGDVTGSSRATREYAVAERLIAVGVQGICWVHNYWGRVRVGDSVCFAFMRLMTPELRSKFGYNGTYILKGNTVLRPIRQGAALDPIQAVPVSFDSESKMAAFIDTNSCYLYHLGVVTECSEQAVADDSVFRSGAFFSTVASSVCASSSLRVLVKPHFGTTSIMSAGFLNA